MAEIFDEDYKTGSKNLIAHSTALVDAYKAYQKLLSKNSPFENKINELMLLAASCAIQCTYCIKTHSKRAKIAGATDEELAFAVHLAASIKHGATMSYGVHALSES